VKQRIHSRHGHLSNEAAAEVAEQIVSDELRHLYLAHVSRECNRPDLAFEIVSSHLVKIGATHVQVNPTFQDVPCPTLTFGAPASVPPTPNATTWPEPPAENQGGAQEAHDRPADAAPDPQRGRTTTTIWPTSQGSFPFL
jgi:hypothetical protein